MADFDLLRESARSAVLPTAEQVRARGRRRTVRTRTLYAGLGALLVLGSASLAATADGGRQAVELPGDTKPTARPGLEAGLDMDVERTSPDGAARVVWVAHVTGAAPQLWSKSRQAFVDGAWELSQEAEWGDGKTSSAGNPDLECRDDAPVIPVDATIRFENPYQEKGTFTARLKVDACGVGAFRQVTSTVTEAYTPKPVPQVEGSVALSEVTRSGFSWEASWFGSAPQSLMLGGLRASGGDPLLGLVLLLDGRQVDSVPRSSQVECKAGAQLVTTQGPYSGQVQQALTPGTHRVRVVLSYCSVEGVPGDLTFEVDQELVVP